MQALALKEEVIEESGRLGEADIVIGIPSYNNAKTIGHVAEMAAQGLARYCQNYKGVIVNADGDSMDGTREAFLGVSYPRGIKPISFIYQGLSGKGSAFRSIFELALLLKTKACILLDSDLKSVTSEWIPVFAHPVLQDVSDYITPLYTRHKYDGTITNHLCYPLTRALYRKQIRQPIGGDFGCSINLVEEFLKRDVWTGDVARFGIDIFMTIIALNAGYRIGQVAIGTKVHDQKDPSLHLGAMFKQVVGTFFTLMKGYEKNWFSAGNSQPVQVVGERKATLPVEEVQVNLSLLLAAFYKGCRQDVALWEKVFSPGLYDDLRYIASLPPSSFQFPSAIWAPCVYDLAVAYHTHDHQDEIIQALIPLYFGRIASFILSTQNFSSLEAERVVEKQCQVFEEVKPYLLERWAAASLFSAP